MTKGAGRSQDWLGLAILGVYEILTNGYFYIGPIAPTLIQDYAGPMRDLMYSYYSTVQDPGSLSRTQRRFSPLFVPRMLDQLRMASHIKRSGPMSTEMYELALLSAQRSSPATSSIRMLSTVTIMLDKLFLDLRRSGQPRTVGSG